MASPPCTPTAADLPGGLGTQAGTPASHDASHVASHCMDASAETVPLLPAPPDPAMRCHALWPVGHHWFTYIGCVVCQDCQGKNACMLGKRVGGSPTCYPGISLGMTPYHHVAGQHIRVALCYMRRASMACPYYPARMRTAPAATASVPYDENSTPYPLQRVRTNRGTTHPARRGQARRAAHSCRRCPRQRCCRPPSVPAPSATCLHPP